MKQPKFSHNISIRVVDSLTSTHDFKSENIVIVFKTGNLQIR